MASLFNTKKVVKIGPILPDWSFDGKNSTEREPKNAGRVINVMAESVEQVNVQAEILDDIKKNMGTRL